MWQGILGHDQIADQFRHILAEGRLASSFVFLGPEGVGKRTFAVKLAQALLCQEATPTALEPCGRCESCRLMESGAHPDLSLVGLPAGKTKLPVDLFLGDRDHRNQEGLCHDIAMRPLLGQRRVAIIDDADYLTTESSNCLLKTLEEPPSGAVLVLVATNRNRLLPTILSRTQVMRFSELSAEQILIILQSEFADMPAEEAQALAEQCRGSVQRALELANSGLGELRGRLLAQLMPSHVDRQQTAAVVQDFVNTADKDPQSRRQQLRIVFRTTAAFYSNVVRASCQSASGELANDPLQFQLFRELGPVVQETALAALDRCLEAETELERNANQATLLECWVDDLSRILTRFPVMTTKS